MKKTIITIACCALMTPLAFAQPRSTHKRHKTKTTTTAEPITVTGTAIKTTTAEGEAANYQPLNTLVVRADGANEPGEYVLNGPGRVVNKKGEVIQTAIAPGTHVRVYYVNTGHSRVVDHVVIED